MTFHYTDWFKGILTMAYHKAQIIGAQNPFLNITHNIDVQGPARTLSQ